ncbi:D-alanyl-D-alanine dipeptidase [Rickettsia tillamookensis]|uniref:D-alanyl-D-alanine dipeptidase n=1 Tax=Rickettsia tillamookensis TaxID=2761623 RepID=A0A9E6MIW0_9RICK|nr:M15 family metallopeptidase [Rickettsia tillamookensis]QQV75600.1 D-alanyl-D-alanine dipeptidase [Rickettsia tillamookensis]
MHSKIYIIISLILFMLQGCLKSKIVSIVDPQVLAIPIKENQDALIDLKNQKIIAFGDSPEIPNNTDYTKIRLTVYNKLVEAQNMLPQGLRFCLYEVYRSLALQEMIFNKRYNEVKKEYPYYNSDKIFLESIRLVSPVVNLDGSHNIPPHSTGGAIDIYLLDEQGNVVDMGIHPKDWIKDIEGLLSKTDSNIISQKAKYYRKIMSNVLIKSGFVNYPTEYWHWSYGDRYWAYHNNKEYAFYGSIK